MEAPFSIFLVFVATTLGITYWASHHSHDAASYFAAGRTLTAAQNGIAVAGDYMSAATFLGFVGLIAFQGYDGFLFPVCGFVSYVVILLLLAEPLRNSGKYTMADVLAYRLRPKPVRAMAALSTLTITMFYMISQMVGAGALVALLLTHSGIGYKEAVTGVGILMIIYVVFGGMLATTWVQIVKAVLLFVSAIFLTFLVLRYFHFSLTTFSRAIQHVTYHDGGRVVVENFLNPGLRYKPPYGGLDLLSLGLGLVFGTAGLPHILVRFYTVPNATTARHSVVWAMGLIGSFFIVTSVLGFGAATILGRDYIASHGGNNMSSPLMAEVLGGSLLFGFISAVAFATILAVVAGLTIAASTCFAHDFWTSVIHNGVERKSGEEVLVARASALAIGAISILIAIILGSAANVGFLATLAQAVAASANFPVLILALYWRRFNTAGAVLGIGVGLVASIGLIFVSPTFMGIDTAMTPVMGRHLIQMRPLFPLENPGILSIPLGFAGAIIGTLITKDPTAAYKFDELLVRSHTGLEAEEA